MANYFGTDGVRGIYGKTITTELANKIGNALAQIKKNPRIAVGTDTRVSGPALMLSLSAGAVQGGASVTYIGIIPTAGVSYLTEKHRFDFGVMITASHNSAEYNGIKIFNSKGTKLSDEDCNFLEEFFQNKYMCEKCGQFKTELKLADEYLSHLIQCASCDFDDLKVCLDASNGASYKIAPRAFKNKYAQVSSFSCKNDGTHINDGCGSLHIENLIEKVQKTQSDIGFAFDGDADRVIAVSKTGKVFDGDKIIYILAKHLKEQDKLFANSVVGTSHTNSGIMVGLNRNKINLVRTDIGDKYVIEAMEKMNLVLGGEQSGHIIIKEYAKTGDGILTALKLCEVVKTTGKTLDELFDVQMIPQANLNISVKDKIKVINNESLNNLLTEISSEISPAGRILVRASGTEEKIRVMVEYTDFEKAQEYANKIKSLIEKI